MNNLNNENIGTVIGYNENVYILGQVIKSLNNTILEVYKLSDLNLSNPQYIDNSDYEILHLNESLDIARSVYRLKSYSKVDEFIKLDNYSYEMTIKSKNELETKKSSEIKTFTTLRNKAVKTSIIEYSKVLKGGVSID